MASTNYCLHTSASASPAIADTLVIDGKTFVITDVRERDHWFDKFIDGDPELVGSGDHAGRHRIFEEQYHVFITSAVGALLFHDGLSWVAGAGQTGTCSAVANHGFSAVRTIDQGGGGDFATIAAAAVHAVANAGATLRWLIYEIVDNAVYGEPIRVQFGAAAGQLVWFRRRSTSTATIGDLTPTTGNAVPSVEISSTHAVTNGYFMVENVWNDAFTNGACHICVINGGISGPGVFWDCTVDGTNITTYATCIFWGDARSLAPAVAFINCETDNTPYIANGYEATIANITVTYSGVMYGSRFGDGTSQRGVRPNGGTKAFVIDGCIIRTAWQVALIDKAHGVLKNSACLGGSGVADTLWFSSGVNNIIVNNTLANFVAGGDVFECFAGIGGLFKGNLIIDGDILESGVNTWVNDDNMVGAAVTVDPSWTGSVTVGNVLVNADGYKLPNSDGWVGGPDCSTYNDHDINDKVRPTVRASGDVWSYGMDQGFYKAMGYWLNPATITGDLPVSGDVVTIDGLAMEVYESDVLVDDHPWLHRMIYDKDIDFKVFYPADQRVFVFSPEGYILVPGDEGGAWSCDNGASGTLLGANQGYFPILPVRASGANDEYTNITEACEDQRLTQPAGRLMIVELTDDTAYDEVAGFNSTVETNGLGFRIRAGAAAEIAHTDVTSQQLRYITSHVGKGFILLENVRVNPFINGGGQYLFQSYGGTNGDVLFYNCSTGTDNYLDATNARMMTISGVCKAAFVNCDTESLNANRIGYGVVSSATMYTHMFNCAVGDIVNHCKYGVVINAGPGEIDCSFVRAQINLAYGTVGQPVDVKNSILCPIYGADALFRICGDVVNNTFIGNGLANQDLADATSVFAHCFGNVFYKLNKLNLPPGATRGGPNFIDPTCVIDASWDPLTEGDVTGINADVSLLTGVPGVWSPVWAIGPDTSLYTDHDKNYADRPTAVGTWSYGAFEKLEGNGTRYCLNSTRTNAIKPVSGEAVTLSSGDIGVVYDYEERPAWIEWYVSQDWANRARLFEGTCRLYVYFSDGSIIVADGLSWTTASGATGTCIATANRGFDYVFGIDSGGGGDFLNVAEAVVHYLANGPISRFLLYEKGDNTDDVTCGFFSTGANPCTLFGIRQIPESTGYFACTAGQCVGNISAAMGNVGLIRYEHLRIRGASNIAGRGNAQFTPYSWNEPFLSWDVDVDMSGLGVGDNPYGIYYAAHGGGLAYLNKVHDTAIDGCYGMFDHYSGNVSDKPLVHVACRYVTGQMCAHVEDPGAGPYFFRCKFDFVDAVLDQYIVFGLLASGTMALPPLLLFNEFHVRTYKDLGGTAPPIGFYAVLKAHLVSPVFIYNTIEAEVLGPNLPNELIRFDDGTAMGFPGSFAGYIFDGNLVINKDAANPLPIHEDAGFAGGVINEHGGNLLSDYITAGGVYVLGNDLIRGGITIDDRDRLEQEIYTKCGPPLLGYLPPLRLLLQDYDGLQAPKPSGEFPYGAHTQDAFHKVGISSEEED